MARANYCCEECGRPVGNHGGGRGEVHHLDPIGSAAGKGRELAADNLKLYCARCHHDAHPKPPVTLVQVSPECWREYLAEKLEQDSRGDCHVCD